MPAAGIAKKYVKLRIDKRFPAPYLCAQKTTNIMERQGIEKEIIATAQSAKHYAELLIAQCDSWLSEEEGRINMEKRIRERKSGNYATSGEKKRPADRAEQKK